jgi:hypothetical protein
MANHCIKKGTKSSKASKVVRNENPPKQNRYLKQSNTRKSTGKREDAGHGNTSKVKAAYGGSSVGAWGSGSSARGRASRTSGRTRGAGSGETRGTARRSGAGRASAGRGRRRGTGGSRETGVDGGAGGSHTVGRLGDAGSVWHGLDLAEGLRGLRVGLNRPAGVCVDTREVLALALARLKGSINIGSRGVVLAANTIKDVLAVLSGIGTGRVACLHAEDVAAHKARKQVRLRNVGTEGRYSLVPLNDLGEFGLVRPIGIGENEATKRIASLVSTVGVHLSSTVIGLHVDLGLIDVADDLNVVGSLHELDTGKGTSGDQTSATTGLGAPCDGLSLGVANNRVGLRWSPNTEVCKILLDRDQSLGRGLTVKCVDDCSLAKRRLVFGGRVAAVVAELGATLATVGVGLVGLRKRFSKVGKGAEKRQKTYQVVPVKVLLVERSALGEGTGSTGRKGESKRTRSHGVKSD